jgi:hypothetical protein
MRGRKDSIQSMLYPYRQKPPLENL